MEDGELNSLIEGLNNANQSGQLVLTQQIQQQNPQTHFVVSPYPTNTFISTSDSPFPTPSPSPSIILRSPAPVKSPIAHLQNIKSPIPVKSPGFQNVKSPSQSFQNVKSPNGNFQNVKSPNLYQVKSPGVSNIKSPASGVVKSPANIRSPGVCNPQSPAQAHSPFQHQVVGSPNSNRSPAPPPPTPSPTAPSPARPNTPQPAVTQYPPIAPNTNQLVQLLQPSQLVGRAQLIPGGIQNQLPKAKQPQQILPKPLPPSTSPHKQSVPRLNTTMSQQTPLLINQPQNPSPTLVLNQVLTSGAPVLVQPAGPGGTVHLMLRPPTPTLQSGPGPPQNKMIITNSAQAQPQATVFIQNRQQVMRIMTAQGPMQLQQIQTPSGPQFIAIPQNQTLSFPTNSVLVQSPTTNTIQVQQNTASTLQLQQSTTNTLQLQQNASAIIQPGSFTQNSLPISQNQISLPNQILQANAAVIGNPNLNKREEKNIITDNSGCLTGANEQKKIVIDNKINNKKNINIITVGNNNNNNLNMKKNSKSGKLKNDDDVINKNVNKNFSKVDNLISNPVSVPSSTTTQTTQKNITSSLRQIRPGAFANRNKQNQNQNTDAKEKSEDANTKSLNNLTRIIDSVASNTEHLISPPPKVDNLTATINSVAENIKSPTPDEIMSNLSLRDVFIPGNKTLTLDKRPNLTIVQKQNKIVQPESDEPNLTINRLILSPNSAASMDFSNISEGYDALELGTVMASAGVQTNENQSFVVEQGNSSSQGMFQNQEDTKKGKKKANNKKKGKKEENRVDLWDLMKSAGIGDDEFDEPAEINTFSQDTATITEGLEISASDTDLLAQLQSASQLPGGIRVVVGEDGRPVIINGNNVIIPDPVHPASQNTGSEPSDAEAVLQNMILPENVFNFTPQALATAQTQLNQLIQDHGGITTSSADQQLLSQIFGSTPGCISTSTSNTTSSGTSANISINTSSSSTSSSNAMIQTTNINSTTNMHQSLQTSQHDAMMLNVTHSETSQATITQKQETKSEFIGGPPPGLPPLGPDSLVITNNNGVPTLVASPALMQYLQTHQGIIQFQHDPVTKTIQPSLIIPHPQHKIEQPTAPQPEIQNDKSPAITNTRIVTNQIRENVINKQRVETKTSVGTTTEDQKNLGSVFNILGTNQNIPNLLKLNMVKFVKENPPLLQMATETNNLITYKESNKNLSEKEIIEIDKKIQQNRAILDQCFLMENNRALQTNATGMPNVVLKESTGKDNIIYQVGSFGVVDKTGDKTTSETQTLEDLQNLDMTLIKGFQPTPAINSPTPTSDFQAKFLESIGMANKNPPKATVSVGTGTTSSPVSAPVSSSTTPAKRGRKKKNEKIQNQSTQVETGTVTDMPSLTFNIAQLTPEQNIKLNQALQNRGVLASQVDNFDAIKQIIHEEVKKITAGALANTSIRFVNAPSYNVEDQDSTEQNNIPSTNMILSNPNLNQLLEQPTNQGNIISLQGNELVAINNGNQQIFTSQNQLLQGGHFVTSNNQILAIGGNHNQLVSLGNPINSSNQIVTLGNPSNIMSVNGNNLAGPQSVIVGSNGNVVAIVHQTPTSGQGSGIVQRVQTIQLTTPKQQHFKTIQSQIQTLSSKANRSATEQTTLQKLIQEQQKILSTGKLVQTIQGQPAQGMQIVSQPVTNQPTRIFQQQQQTQQIQQTQQEQTQTQQQVQQTFITANASTTTTQVKQTNFRTHAAVSCGTSTSDFNATTQQNIPKLSVPPTVMISDGPVSNYGPLYVSPNTSGKNVTKCEKGTSPIQIQMGTQTVTNVEYRSGKMSTGTMTSPNTGKPQAIVAPAIVIQQTENQSPPWQMKPRNQASMSPMRNQLSATSRSALIEKQMRKDQTGATMPDTHTPFLSKSDACKRLLQYHVMDEKALSPQDLATADDIFETTAQHLLDKFKAMKEKYKYLLMLESMRETTAAEVILITKLVITQEEEELIELREMKKRLQDEYDNPTISYSNVHELNAIKTELMLDDVGLKNELKPEISIEDIGLKSEIKSELGDVIHPDDIKTETSDEENDIMISNNNRNNSDIHSESTKDNPFKLTESNRNFELTKMKSETKECKNTRTMFPGSRNIIRSRSASPQDFEELDNISSKCKTKTNRTFSDGSSKSSLDNSKDEDSGTDINAQVQSAIDSILNLQKSETRSNSPDEGSTTSSKRLKKKRKHGEKSIDGSKKLKFKESSGKRDRSTSDESDEDDECETSQDQMLDEAIRSILTS